MDNLCIKNIRVLVSEMIDKAKSGHPGMAIGAAPIIHTLFTKFLNVYPEVSDWCNRDYFVLSSGHASSLLYAILHLSGYDLSIDDLKQFRQLHSKTPGHPESIITKGVDASTGPLGQGIGYAVGIAIAEEYLRSKTDLIDHYTYVLCGDGDLQEGITQEALSLAGNLNLSRLIILYDSNDIQLDGFVSKTLNENNKEKYEAMGFNYQLVSDGNDVSQITNAIDKAKKSNKPSFIEFKTIIGFGTSKAGTNKVHGSPLPHDEVVEMRQKLNSEAFTIFDEVYQYYKENVYNRGKKKYEQWLQNYNKNHQVLDEIISNEFTCDIDKILKQYNLGEQVSTRKAGGEILKQLASYNPSIIGGTADLSSSTMQIGVGGDFNSSDRGGRYINFGVRESAMGSIGNGIAIHNLKPFVSTFFVFSDYLKPALRLSALSQLPVVYIFTHDSIAVGEDGPTHEPIEHLTNLRSIPNLNVIRPADANETIEAYKIAFNEKTTPTALVLSRQNLEVVSKNPDVKKGGYIISDSKGSLPEAILIASGSEVNLALKVKDSLKDEFDIRVVSMPSTTLFDKQTEEYKESVIPSAISRVMAIEMSEASHYYKYVGKEGIVYGINKFGLSSPSNELLEEYGFTVEKIVKAFKTMKKVDYIKYID